MSVPETITKQIILSCVVSTQRNVCLSNLVGEIIGNLKKYNIIKGYSNNYSTNITKGNVKSKKDLNDEIKIISFFKKVEKLKYYKNPQETPFHEIEIKKLLFNFGIQYQHNPNGTQRFPDFYLPEYNLNIECKSTSGIKPMWNLGIPIPDAVYILGSKKLNQNTFFWGKEVCPKETYDRLVKNHKHYREVINKYNREHNDGWIIYPRLAFDNKGNNAPKYWDPKFRENVINFNWDFLINR